jgi:hypothetical protein
MVGKKRSRSPKTIWTYAYQIVPPQAEGRLHSIKQLLDNEHADADRGARTWTGRVILEQRVTHILVVSDSPERREVNLRLETAMKELGVRFVMTAPLAVADDGAQ